MRPDLGIVAEMVPRGARVLDLGCGDGALLEDLIRHRGCLGQGVEVSEEAFHACLARGIPVVSADIDQGLPDFADDSFDVVVLTQTLQTVHRPALVLREMMRVAPVGIVSFPNYGHIGLRARLFFGGRVPSSPLVPEPWFETPNIHPCTLRDFERFLKAEGVRATERVLLDRWGGPAPDWVARRPNLLASAAAYRLRR